MVLQTIRSHDQYSTTFYGLDDWYRGPGAAGQSWRTWEDPAKPGFAGRDLVDVVSTFRSKGRQADKFRLVQHGRV